MDILTRELSLSTPGALWHYRLSETSDSGFREFTFGTCGFCVSIDENGGGEEEGPQARL